MSYRFADAYLHLAALVALTPALMVAAATAAPLAAPGPAAAALQSQLLDLAPQIALASVAAGLFGVAAALAAGFSRLWLRALIVLAITTATLFAYVWHREAGSGMRWPAAPAAEGPIVPPSD